MALWAQQKGITMRHLDNPMPLPGESEFNRQIRVYGIDFALDTLECGAIEDGIVSMIRIVGETNYVNVGDPLYVDGNDTIVKRMPSSDLRATRIRWATMGRRITDCVVGERIA